jgi:hypothetical protein
MVRKKAFVCIEFALRVTITDCDSDDRAVIVAIIYVSEW